MRSTFTFILLLAVTNLFSQKIDLVNAPKNPVAYQYKLEHFALRGPVFASGNKIFSKEGLLIFDNVFYGKEYFYDNKGRLTHTSEGNEFKYGSNGYIESYSYASLGVKATEYVYNNKGLLIAQKYDQSANTYSYEYTYDNQDRITKKFADATNYTTYTYQKKGDDLIINETDVRDGKSKLTVYTYNKGIQISFDEVLMSKYNTKDAYGNWTRDFNPVIFYDDIKTSGNQFSMVYTKSDYSVDKLRDCKFFLNGKQTDAVYKRLLNNKDVLIYNPFEGKYVIVNNAIEDVKTGQNQIFTEAYIYTPAYLDISQSTSYKLIYKGAEYQNNLYLRTGSLKVNTNHNNYLVYDEFADKTFFTMFNPDKKFTFYAIKEVEGTNIIYVKSDDSNKFLTIDKGKPIKASDYSVGYNGNDAILYNGQTPEYYLPQYKTAAIGVVNPGRKFNPSTDKSVNSKGQMATDYASSNNTPASGTTNSNCLNGNCIDGYGEYKTDEYTLLGLFKNGKANGYCLQMYKSGNYMGNFKDGFRDGFGTYRWNESNQIYTGEWKLGKQHGYGYYFTNNVISSAGYYENGMQIINMFEAYKNNQTSNGCLGNCTEGFGTLTYQDGAATTGFFKNGKINGPATITWSNKDVYSGNWIDNVRQGNGFYVFSDTAAIYYGGFENNKRNGWGMLFDKDSNFINKGIWVDNVIKTSM